MSKHLEYLYDTLAQLREHVTVYRFPRNKKGTLIFSLPEYIHGVPIFKHLVANFDLSLVDAKFILDNLKHCKYIQPTKEKDISTAPLSPVIIGQPAANTITITDVDYGQFKINYTSRMQSCNPKDLNSLLTSYTCSNGITAFVHECPTKQGIHRHVYYSNNIVELIDYAKMMVPSTLWSQYMSNIVGGIKDVYTGEYHETYRR